MKKEDLHLHTTVSDGVQSPFRILELAAVLGLERIAITDHDALDAHRAISRRASGGVEVITGIEIDCSFEGHNIEILGYHIDIENGPLNGYLSMIQGQRKERALAYIGRVNEHFGSTVLQVEEVIPEGRVTVLKPHIINPLLEKRLFADYGEAKEFLATIRDRGFSRATAREAMALIHGAGGKAVLAHPGVYPFARDLVKMMIDTLKDDGIDGVETYYPYHERMTDRFPERQGSSDFIMMIERQAQDRGLLRTRGTDSHNEEDFVKLNSSPAGFFFTIENAAVESRGI
jgi:3',5'-nucleoside bisphosphate phosphatase